MHDLDEDLRRALGRRLRHLIPVPSRRARVVHQEHVREPEQQRSQFVASADLQDCAHMMQIARKCVWVTREDMHREGEDLLSPQEGGCN